MRNEAAIKSSEIFRNVAKSTCLGVQFKGGACVIAGLACRRGRRGMEARATGDIFQFDDFRLDRRGLCRGDAGGVFVPVAIGSRACEVVRVLVAGHGDLVLKNEIIAAVWPGMVVEDSNLTVQISALRRIL